MPDKQLQMATYAAGASLAAITLVYVFAPTFFIDGEAESSSSSRKRGVVGLHNQANDCFINSTVQALAGLGDLRLYLIRETHRRALDGPAVYRNLVEDPTRKNLAPWKIEGLQEGLITQGLKELLDTLNERPIYKKTASASGFVKCLEGAFRQRISRQQQDAQEFLQVVAERLCDEYHAGRRARKRAAELGTIIVDDETLQKRLTTLTLEAAEEEGSTVEILDSGKQPETEKADINNVENAESPIKTESPVTKAEVAPSAGEGELEEESFPLEGGYESQIECLTCGFKPKPNISTFCTLTLNVPELPSTTLSSCFDGIFKLEYIDDFKCEKCRLIHAVETLQKDPQKCKDEKLTAMIARINEAIATDPENPTSDLTLPDAWHAPKRKIKRHIRITSFPKVLALHLSRSIFEARASTKNAAKVSFPETLPLGSIIDQRRYKLLALVTHKGSHSSGHYETFRRQTVAPPFANQGPFGRSDIYSRTATPATSTPQLRATPIRPLTPDIPSPHPAASSSSLADSNSQPTTDHLTTASVETIGSSESSSSSSAPSPRGREKDGEGSSLRSATRASLSKLSKNISSSLSRPGARDGTPAGGKENAGRGEKVGRVRARRQRKAAERWWRISDERVKESKTSEVLGMQKEVYLLFYELIR
ncbi:hypothetical protein VC83_01031 [Pseudogymnoascus destructans]|uniref:Ubiquitin carboxyl-terminal hydrolase n=2 Tax=Pseudogymnoascus destructans TaxID=655981 RepID=L8FP21_PSED2|nr:uncharacterized protein VC83_01031 [Pseudogymnoascus destructans]ELR02632.1 hypothetical protein GMDG_05593 [Pseudogymnoascus destructans 20631-21]OAF62193.1 hypothetical protein VC83_01031 [Pseudogymnoascus destructans]